MSRYTKDDIFRMVEEEDVEFIRLQFTDIFGTLKNIAITSSQLEKALDNKCMFDGSSVEGFVRIEESDMYLYPDYDTFEIFPWRPQQGKVARLICDVYTPDGKPFEGDPRWILKKTIKEANDLGYRFDVGPECEFFLFHTDDNGLPTTLSHEKAGYFDLGPNDLGENIRRDMVLTLEDMGFEIEASHHEVAPAQHEIDFKYDEALKTADNIQTFKMTVKTIAKRHGLYATFMPKPKFGISGSGMHINMSLATKEGKNIFADENGKIGLSDDAYHFIAGIMKHARGMSAITNPLVNSYKRLVPGYEAKGIRTDKGELNRWIKATNRLMLDIKKKIKSLFGWISEVKEELSKPKTPSLADLLISYYQDRNAGAWSQKAKGKNLKEFAEAVNYLMENKLLTLEALESRLSAVSTEFDTLSDTMKAKSARMKELQELIRQAENYKRLKPVYDELNGIKWKKQREKFETAHDADLRLFYTARRILKEKLDRKPITLAAWKQEYDRLQAEYAKLSPQYKPLREDLMKMRRVQYCVDRVLQRRQPEQEAPKKKQDIEL